MLLFTPTVHYLPYLYQLSLIRHVHRQYILIYLYLIHEQIAKILSTGTIWAGKF